MKQYQIGTKEGLTWALAHLQGRIEVIKYSHFSTEEERAELTKLLELVWDVQQSINKFNYWFHEGEPPPPLPF